MDLTLQPKPEVEITRADKGILTKRQYFVEKQFEEINQYCCPAHLIRNWKPRAQLIYPSVSDEASIQYECDFNRSVQNCFVEDYAEEVFLRTPPPCFVVIGKCGKSVNKLGQDIAKEYGSVLIQVDDIINQVIQTDTETSELLRRILRLGVSLTLNFILPLLSFLAHAPEARHRGYVLCGLPRAPEGYDLPVEQQFNYLFAWDNKPTVFINVLFDDEDLIKERTNLRCETKTAEEGKVIVFHPEVDELSEDEDDVEDPDVKDLLPIKEETIPSNTDIDISPSRPWVRLPKDEEPQVWSELELFNVLLKPAVDLISSRVDPQYFITVDSRVENEFEIVRARLSLLQIWKSPLAFPFIKPKPKKDVSDEDDPDNDDEEEEENEESIDGEDADILRVSKEPPQVAFLTLFTKKTLSPKFRWELSHYNYICPVSLRESEIVEGKSAYAVAFMKYIYFLRDEECMKKFLQNPRAYVLPIRPKPLCRFIIIGYPFTGKTTLAKNLAEGFSIPLLDLNTILSNDIDRKMNIYRNFCKQKAECREILRLTNLAWQDWRMEEEQRVTLIEQWILYIQSLLSQRLTQFYSPESAEEETKVESPLESTFLTEMQPEDDAFLGESKTMEETPLEIRGVTIDLGGTYLRERTPIDDHSTPSVRIIHAMKHEDFDFNENGMEVEANLFFSSLWNKFSTKGENPSEKESIDGEGGEIPPERESIAIDWFKLLPPQSLSTLLMSRKPYTIREKRRSFQVLLEAASKNYWTVNSLKGEFAKWRLPCFMDIPLCEIFLDNPILLLKYVPDWLKERPAIPEPVDPNHPSVIEAGEKAFARANVVKITQNKEEIAILLRDAVEKAEREGMRVTGEVISPGGWVLDNMTLDIDVWKKLACENIFADHVYILIDPDPEYKRILNIWCDLFCPPEESSESDNREEDTDDIAGNSRKSSNEEVQNILTDASEKRASDDIDLCKTIQENVELLNQNEEGLDDLYSVLEQNEPQPYEREIQLDPFSYCVLCSMGDKNKAIKVESIHEDMTSAIMFHSGSINFTINGEQHNFFSKIQLGTRIEIFTDKILNLFEKPPKDPELKKQLERESKNALQFFIDLLTLPQKLDQIRELLTSLNRENTVTEIDITGKEPTVVFKNMKKELLEPFIKKPRELENFEIDEIQKWTNTGNVLEEGEEEEDLKKKEEEEEEDIRIFGESGSLCIVNLERNILLPGKLEYALRYYGKLYYFWNESAKNQFIDDPEKYAPYYSAIRCYPPLRIFVMGPIGCGKTKLCHAIADQCSLSNVDYLAFLNRNLVPCLKRPCAKFTALYERPLLLKEDYNAPAKAAKEKFMNSPVSYRTQWLECPFYSKWSSYKNIIDSQNASLSKVPSTFPELIYRNIEPGPDNDSLLEEYDLPPPAPFIGMREIQFILNEYIQNVSDLNEFCVEKTLKKLWTHRPYITDGFVLEGFPMRGFDVKRMIDNNWIPDLIIEVNLSEDILIESNIEPIMDLWDTKLQQEIVEEKLLEDTLDIIQRSSMWSRREALTLEKIEEATAKYNTLNEELRYEEEEDEDGTKQRKKSNSYEYQSNHLPPEVEFKIGNEIDKLMLEEFPPLEFKVEFETYEAGKARLLDDLLVNYRRDLQEIHVIKELLQGTDVEWYQVNSENDYETNLNAIFMLLDKLKKRINKKGEFAFTMKMEMAEKLLEQGYYFLSKFGRWCPVQVYRMKNSIHMFRPLSSRGKVVPIAYRNYIYFVAGENEKKNFLEDPIKYTFNDPHHPNIPVRVAVIGPPKSGKSTLCSRLGAMFDLKIVTMGTALRFVVEKIPHSTLAKNVNGYLKRGCFLPLSLKIEAVMACLNDPACVTQGFVLDGIPFDAALTQSLAERGKLPFVIISLTTDVDFGKTNRQNLNLTLFRLPYKNRENLEMRYRDWNESHKKFSQWNQLTYSNLYEVDAKLSIVDIFYQAYDIIRKSLFGIYYYVENCVTDKVLPLQYLCVSQQEYELRKDTLENNCPVCWKDLKRLSPTTDPPERSGLVQYMANFYWVCPDHMEKFRKTPKIYFPPHAEEGPKILPKMITEKMYEAMSPQPKIHGYGRCPVTRIDFPAKLDWEGSWDFAALYSDEVYLCKDKEMLDRFLAQPWNYTHADTIFEVNRTAKSKAVKELEPPVITSLPPIGFLEQTIAGIITNVLRCVGSVRPIYPNISLEVTGCVFMALLLKVENPKSKCRGLVNQYVNFMLENCQAVSYSTKKERPAEALLERVDFEPHLTESIESDASQELNGGVTSSSQLSVNSYWLDVEAQGDKQIWSAEMTPSFTKLILTADDELVAIPSRPKTLVILKYQSYVLRRIPFPPIHNCVSHIYSARPNMELPEPFNYNSLYQPLPSFLSPYPTAMVFNPEKEFPLSLYNETESDFPSKEDMRKGPRAYSVRSLPDFKQVYDPNYDVQLVIERFAPRFQFLDKIPLFHPPSIPKVVKEEPILFNPQREQTYMMLYAEFFHMSHVLRCYEWSAVDRYLELDDRYGKNLGLAAVDTEFLHPPRKQPSVELKKPISNYHDVLDAYANFVSPTQQEPTGDDLDRKFSLINFIQTIILEKIEEIFAKISYSDLSYESFETVIESDGKTGKPSSIVIREIIPYPPLPWDIISRPYFAYTSVNAIFNVPALDSIAHERHFSLLDGIEQEPDKIRFLRYPSWLNLSTPNTIQGSEYRSTEKSDFSIENQPTHNQVYFAYDFFNLPWTSFLTYPFSWAYNEDVTSYFHETVQNDTEEDSKLTQHCYQR